MIIFSFIASYSGYKSSISEFNKLLKIQLKLEAELMRIEISIIKLQVFKVKSF